MYGLRPGLLPMLMAARNQQPQPVEYAEPDVMSGFGYVPGYGYVPIHPNAAQIVAHNQQQRYENRHPNQTISGEEGESWGADEDEDEFGSDAYAEDDADIEAAVYGAPGRLFRKRDRLSKKQGKWEARSQTARTDWGRRRAEKKAGKFEERLERIDNKIARKTGGGAGGAGGPTDDTPSTSAFYGYQVQAPPQAGSLLFLPLLPVTAPGTSYAGEITSSSIKATVPAGLVTEDIQLQTPSITFAKARVVGIVTDLSGQRDAGVSLEIKDLKVEGGQNLLPYDGYNNGNVYQLRDNQPYVGLRKHDFIDKTARLSVYARIKGDNGDVARFSIQAVVDFPEDSAPRMSPQGLMKRPPGAWSY